MKINDKKDKKLKKYSDEIAGKARAASKESCDGLLREVFISNLADGFIIILFRFKDKCS